MASSRAVFLLCLFIAAGAARTGCAAVVRGCEPEILDAVVGLFCSTRAPGAACCRALAHSVRRGGLGCLCRLAAERPLVSAALNATDLLRLYAACVPPRHGAAGLASACDAGAHAPTVGDGSSLCVAGRILADQMEIFCGRRSPNAPCRGAVVASVALGGGDVPCFCAAARESGVGVRGVVDLYTACLGLRTGPARRLAGMWPRHPRP